MDVALAVLLVVTAVATLAYWADFFLRGAVHAVEADWYIRFQRAFPAADAFMAAMSAVAAAGLLMDRRWGTAFGLVAAGALAFLGLTDVLFNLENRLYRLLPASTAMWAELVVNVWALALAGLLIVVLVPRVA